MVDGGNGVTVVGMDPVAAAWHAYGESPGDPTNLSGPCARCGTTAALTPTAAVVSRGYTAMDTWAHRGSPGLCPACVWAFREPALRQHPHQVTRDPAALTRLSWSQLRRALTAPLHSAVAVTVPTRAGHKHVLPAAQWGRVTLDDTPLPWTRADALRLRTLETLRADGVPPKAFTADAPPWSVIGGVSPPTRTRILEGWEHLRPWRARRLWLQLALLATSHEHR